MRRLRRSRLLSGFSVALGLLALGLLAPPATQAQNFGNIPPGDIIGNPTTQTAPARPMPFPPTAATATTRADLSTKSTAANPTIIRTGFYVPGDVPALLYVAQAGPCTIPGGNGGSQVPSADGNCWVARTTDPLQFGARAGTAGFQSVTTIAGNPNVTFAGASYSSADKNKYITILGAGGFEQRLITQITDVGGPNSITVATAPSQAMSNFSTLVYSGFDSSAAINAAIAAANGFNSPTIIPAGIFMAASPIQCTVVNYNNLNLGQPACVGVSGAGATIMAVANMASSTPKSGILFTVGGFANGGDFSQFIRNGQFDGHGLTLDANFIANTAAFWPFFQDSHISHYNTKNATVSNFRLGMTGSPITSAGVTFNENSAQRDLFNVPITGISCAGGVPTVTTSIDHGIPTGRIVVASNVNSVPGSVTGEGPTFFLWTSTGVRTGTLHGVNCSGWAAYTGGGWLNMTFPSNALMHTITNVTGANPAQVTISPGNINMANGQIWCTYGIGGSTTPFVLQKPAPDGCFQISNVTGAGADGPFSFATTGVNSTGFTFAGGGLAFERMTLGSMGVYEENMSDVNASNNFITGSQYAFYADPNSNGYDGKYTNNHVYNLSHGWLIAGHYLGGHNTLTGEQCDAPLVFCGQFFHGGSSSQGSSLQGGTFGFILDAATWLWRLDSCSGADCVFRGISDFTSTGDKLFGRSPTLRVNELSNQYLSGNVAYYASIPNYHSFGNQPGGFVLYSMPDSAVGTSTQKSTGLGPVNFTSTTAVAAGLGPSCSFIPVYHTGGTFTMTGTIGNNTVGDGAYGALYLFTTPPPAGGSLSGSFAITGESGLNGTASATTRYPFTWTGSLPQTTLSPGTTYYMDAGVRTVTGGTGSIQDLTCTLTED